MVRSLLACSLFVAAVGLMAMPALGQATLPDGWQELPAGEFADAAEAFLAADPAQEPAREVVEHAWQNFLNDESFITTGDWDTVERLMGLFVGRRSLLVTGSTFAEREEAERVMQEDAAILRSRLETRTNRDPSLVTDASFDELWNLSHVLEWSGVPAEERGQHFVSWMAANDWQGLSLENQEHLMVGLEVDKLDKLDMSVRWTGFITAPASGAYTFEQLRHYLIDSEMKVFVNDQLVLDSVRREAEQPGDAERDPFRSSPVPLQAGEPTPIRVEFVHRSPRIEFNLGYPVAVLLWDSEAIDRQIVPHTAFSPPPGFRETPSAGLRGEYFADPIFMGMVEERLDPGIDFIWKYQPVVPTFGGERRQIIETVWPRLLDENYLSSLTTAEEKDQYLTYGVKGFGGWVLASEREAMLQRLLAHPELIRAMEPYHMAKILEHFYILPSELRVELIGRWAELRPQPRHELGSIFGWEEGTYQWNNLQFYWMIGSYFVPEHREALDRLVDDYLERANGDCNLAVAYVVAWANLSEVISGALVDRIREALEDESLTGDQRMTWLLARAYQEEIPGDGVRLSSEAVETIQEASLVAQSVDYRFWAFQEIVARLGSYGQAEEAKSLIAQRRETFSTPEQRAAMQAWEQHIDELAAIYPSHNAERQDEQRRSRLAAYIGILRQRLENAQARNNSEDVEHYRELIQSAESQVLDR